MHVPLAAIDIGSNAVRLAIARPRRDGSLKTLYREREPVRLGHEVFATGAVSDVTAVRLIATLRRFAAICDQWGAPRRVIATAALRDATNRDDVSARARAARVPFELVSGDEEARLTCLGATFGAPAGHRTLCIDLGGGSTEIGLAVGGEAGERFSLDLGAARLAARFPGDSGAQRRFVAEVVSAALPDRRGGPRHAVGTSGTLRALCEFAAGKRGPLVERDELPRVLYSLAALGPAGRRRIFEARAEQMIPAALILDAIARRLHLDTFSATRRGLRDGILVELSRRSIGERPAPPALAAAAYPHRR